MALGMVGAVLAFLLFLVNGSRRRRRRKAELEIQPPDAGKWLCPAGHHWQEKPAAITGWSWLRERA